MAATELAAARTTVAHITGEEDLPMAGEGGLIGTCPPCDAIWISKFSRRYLVASVHQITSLYF